ncbi:MAG: DUF5694 domain-containing protein [Cytophagales bacterium]|nr:DUF5694 domain-containing protein [Cytophagales bacterium]
MRTFIALFTCCICQILWAQSPLEVTIIGTTHAFQKEYQDRQDFQQVRDFMVNLDPDIICIEAIPATDTLSLQEIWPKNMKRADRLREALIEKGHLPYDARAYASATESNRFKGAISYAAYDFWNAYYYWFQVMQSGDSLNQFAPYMKNLSRSEYGLIVYPAAMELGIDQFHLIDYRAGENAFLGSTQKVLKKLLFRFKWKPLGTYLKTQKRYKKAEEAGQLMEFINGPAFQVAFNDLIDILPRKLRKVEEAQFVKDYWLKRNEVMANRIIDTARKQDASTVLLTVGSAHVMAIKNALERRGHVVRTYGEFINKNS